MNDYKNDLCENNYDAPAIEMFEVKMESGIAQSVPVMKNEDLL